MIYRVHFYDDQDCSSGYGYYGSAKKADKALKDWQIDSPDFRQNADIEAVAVPKSKAEVIALLQRWASHEENG